MKHELLTFRRELWPHRDMISVLIRQESGLITDQTDLYLRDCHDHVVQLVDMIETYREIASGLLDVYLSSLSNRMNEIMKVLTIIATIFIPFKLHFRRLRHEFRPNGVEMEHAGARLGIWLSFRARPDGRDRRRPRLLFLA